MKSAWSLTDEGEAGGPIISGRPHDLEWTRDIPRSCICEWEWNHEIRAYELVSYKYECPWHSEGGG